MARQSIALGGCSCGRRNDFVPSANRRISCRWILADWKMKKKLIILVVVAVVLLGAIYLWEPGTVPVGQHPLVTLSPTNVNAFEAAFDADADVPRLVLLLSPT
jgi:hypothetical protein